MAHTLYLLRHGQAQPAHGPGLKDDHARSLSSAGQREIAQLATVLSSSTDVMPEKLLVSSATRTQETARALGLQDYGAMDQLYNADLSTLYAVLRDLDTSCESALLIAHNPGISWLAASLLQPQPCQGFAPGAFVQLELTCAWPDLGPGCAQLKRRLDPPNYQ